VLDDANVVKYTSQPPRVGAPEAWLNQGRWSSMSTVHEEWRPVVGHEGVYEVSSLGRIKRVAAAYNSSAGRILEGFFDASTGYQGIVLSHKNKRWQGYVHHLVMAAFVGPLPEGQEVNHKDGNKLNNARSNLEYLTHPENQKHAAETGLYLKGEQQSQAKLTEQAVREIRNLRHVVSQRELAKHYGVSQTVIGRVQRRRLWSHVE
jgi:hypothetical protein